MALEHGDRFAAGRVPQPHRAVVEADTIRLPSGLKLTWVTWPVCPCRTATGLPLAASQTRTVDPARRRPIACCLD